MDSRLPSQLVVERIVCSCGILSKRITIDDMSTMRKKKKKKKKIRVYHFFLERKVRSGDRSCFTVASRSFLSINTCLYLSYSIRITFAGAIS